MFLFTSTYLSVFHLSFIAFRYILDYINNKQNGDNKRRVELTQCESISLGLYLLIILDEKNP